MKKIVTFFILILLGTRANAETVQIDGIYYNLSCEDDPFEIPFGGIDVEGDLDPESRILIDKARIAEVTSCPDGYSGDVVIPSSVEYGGYRYSVTSIGQFAFYGCSGLTSITISSGVTMIGSNAFSGCLGLTSITIPNSVTDIGANAFSGCQNLSSINLSNSITLINSKTFSGCKSLESVIIPEGVASIGSWAFENCSEMRTVSIPNSVETIGIYAFYNCGLTSLTIPNSVLTIGQNAFQNCKQLSEVHISNGIETIGSYVFAGCGLASVTIPYGVKSIGFHSFDGCQQLKNINIPESVTSIGMYAFQNSGLTSAIIPNSVTSINYLAFAGCRNLVGIDLPDNLDEIRSETFSGCSGLTSIIIPEGISRIESKSFANCINLLYIGLPNSINSISSDAFTGCTNLCEVKVAQMTPMRLSNNTFENCQNATLYVLEGSKNAYEKANVWKDFKEIVEYDNNDSIHLLTVMAYGGYVNYKGDKWNSGITTSQYSYSVLKQGENIQLSFPFSSAEKISYVTINGQDVTSSIEDNKYLIENVSSDICVKAIFSDIESEVAPSNIHLLTVMAYGGYVNYKGDEWNSGIITSQYSYSVLKQGENIQLSFPFSSAEKLSYVTINGQDVTSSIKDNKYLIENVSSDICVKAVFSDIESEVPPSNIHLLTVMAYGGDVKYKGEDWNSGIITSQYSYSVLKQGENIQLSFPFSSAEKISYVTINGQDVTSSIEDNKYLIENVSSDCIVKVMFKTHQLSVVSSAGGSFSYLGSSFNDYGFNSSTSYFTVIDDASATLTFTPNSGYRLSSVKVNDMDVTSKVSNNSYTISDIRANTAVVVAFETIPRYTLSITSSGGGDVTYSTYIISNTTNTYTFDEGTSVTLMLIPNSGYQLGSVKVNDVDVTSGISESKYTISNINQNTTVSVTFEAIPPTTYSLTITSLGNGWVYCAEEEIYNATRILTYDEGTSAKLTFSPVTGYRVKLLSVNGIDVTSDIVDDQYTIINISNNTTVNVTFEAIPPTTYSLTISSTGSGNVTYIDNIINGTTRSYTVNEGTKAVLTITPDKGCRIKMVKVNGIDVTSMVTEDLYTINNINQNTTVEVTFETIPSYILTITSSGTGFVVYSYYTVNNTTKSFTVEGSSSVTLTFNTIDGYRLESLIVNDEDVTSDVSDNQYVIDNISQNAMVKVTFEKIPIIPTYSLTITSLSNGKVYCGEVEISNAAKIFSFDEVSSVELVLQPNNGYRLELLSVNGIDVTSDVEDNHYTISNISKNTTVTVAFEAIPPTTYTLSITSSGSGYVIYSGTTINNATESFTVNEGTSATLTFTPNTGYRIESLKVNGVDVSSYISDNKCTINEIKLNTTVSVTFEAIPQTTYTLTIASSDNGYVSYSGNTINSETNSFTIQEGSSAFFVFTPHSGFQIGCLIVDGVDVTSSISDNNYTIGNIKQNTTVSVIFVEEQKEINVAKALEIINALADGETTSEKYQVKGFVVGALDFQRKADGSLYGNVNCTIADEQDSATLLTVFRAKNFGNENFTEETISTIKEGDEVVIEGQLQKYVKDGLYTPEIKNCYIVNIIKNNECTLTISSVGNGSVVYSDNNITGNTNSYSVNEGASASLTFTPNSGYRIGSVKVNGVDVTSSVLNNEYTIRNIKENTTVSVIFEKIPPMTYTLSITSSGGGDVTYSGNAINETTKSFTVNEGTSATFTFTPNSGYRLNSVKVNNVDVTSSVSNNTYTINSIGQNTTVSVEFVEELKSMTVDGVNYVVSSYDNRTVKVASGRYNNVLTVPATFTYQGMTWNVVGIDKGALAGNTELAAIIWNPSVAFTESVSNSNLLLYVKAAQYAPSGIKNVVVNGAANSITLAEATSGNDFYCPDRFIALQISYTHNYSMTTGVGECRGWETIALPFNVQTITHSTKGEIVPFAKWQEGDSRRPFWLYELTSSGWREASDIKAYTPYIISMPNNDLYYDEARLNGSITFSAQNTTIGVTEVKTSTYGGRTFTPNFRNKTAGSNIYVLNVVNSLVTNKGGMTEGSQFIQDLRAVHPFEAYMTTTNNARASFGIFEDMTTSIRGITELIDKERSKDIYNLKGQKMEAEKEGRLPAGVYIINGQKMMVK